jgi:hypothetical protein
MKQLSAESTNTLNLMVGMMNVWCAKIDKLDGEFMPVFISTTYEDDSFKIFAVGHYYSENGDIMADPEMQFLFDVGTGSYFPVYYRQDCIDIEQNSARIDEGHIIGVDRILQSQHTEFANQWLTNIRLQQNLY